MGYMDKATCKVSNSNLYNWFSVLTSVTLLYPLNTCLIVWFKILSQRLVKIGKKKKKTSLIYSLCRYLFNQAFLVLSGRIRLPSRKHNLDSWIRKIPWRRKWQSTPLFLLGNSMDRGALWATVYGVRESQIGLSNQTTTINNKSLSTWFFKGLYTFVASSSFRNTATFHQGYSW